MICQTLLRFGLDKKISPTNIDEIFWWAIRDSPLVWLKQGSFEIFMLSPYFGQPLKNAPSQGAFFDALGSRPFLK